MLGNVSVTKRTRIALLVASVVSLGALLLFWDREPRARGHSLSTWLGVLRGENEAELSAEDAQAAIKEMGERAIPTLLEKIQAQDPAWKKRFYRISSGLRLPLFRES